MSTIWGASSEPGASPGIARLANSKTSSAVNLTEAVVRVRLHRARAHLREWIGDHAQAALDGTFSFAGQRCDRIVAGVLARIGIGNVPTPR